jgi:hypothetical protein
MRRCWEEGVRTLWEGEGWGNGRLNGGALIKVLKYLEVIGIAYNIINRRVRTMLNCEGSLRKGKQHSLKRMRRVFRRRVGSREML